ncbi:hypothetical protein [Paracoccus jeotgali]|uniref:hypothetical protein n=1 Tax=Paracoccus jeotgali TaxID=2065379 RepID=UPI0028AB976A|nr:hypothetical protein [Paracoccus jeotgali]
MAQMTLSQAAKATGKSKSTLNRAIKSGKLSAARNDDGTFSIDPAELFRAFPERASDPTPERPAVQAGTGELQSRVNTLEALLQKEREALEREREALQREREISDDLKEDRDRWRQQATALLADQRSDPPLEPPPRRRWWPWSK